MKDGATIGSIGAVSGNPFFANATTGGFKFGTSSGSTIVDPVNETGAVEDATHDLGSSGGRWRNLYLSSGVYLGGTGSANHLDDYEEGFHEPTVTMSTSGSVTLSTSFDRFSYTKIGRLVTITGNPRIDSVSSPVGGMTFTLPFTSASGAADEKRSGFVVNYYDASAGTGAHRKFVSGQVSDNANVVTLDLVNSHNNNITPASGDEVYFNFSYIVP